MKATFNLVFDVQFGVTTVTVIGMMKETSFKKCFKFLGC
jgi:hypothetical protein